MGRSIAPGLGMWLLSGLSGVLAAEPLNSAELNRLATVLSGRGLDRAGMDLRGLPETYQRVARAVPFIASKDGTGSGYVVGRNPDGTVLVVTNHHVVEKPYQDNGGEPYVLILFFDLELAKSPFEFGRVVSCRSESGPWCQAFRGAARRAVIVGSDPVRDLAILLVRDVPSGVERLQHSPVGTVKTGQEIIVVGHPRRLLWTLTTGIVSSVREEFPTESPSVHISVIQTQAPINPGNSGGPMTSLDGRVLGVVFSKRQDSEGLNFAIAIEEVEGFVSRLAASKGSR